MAGSDRQRARELRREDSDDGVTFRGMKVIGAGRNGDTPYVSPTDTGAQLVGFEIGDEVTVSVFDDAVVITTDE